MNRIYLIVLLLLSNQSVSAQMQLKAYWDYPDIDMVSISRFEVKIDNGNYEQIGIPPQEILPTTQPANHSYGYIIPFTTRGTHTIAVRACDVTECSFDTSVAYKWIGSPSNLRVVH